MAVDYTTISDSTRLGSSDGPLPVNIVGQRGDRQQERHVISSDSFQIRYTVGFVSWYTVQEKHQGYLVSL